MSQGFQPISGAKVRQLRLVALGLAVLLVATIVGGVAIGFATIDRLGAVQSGWLEFRHVTSNKGQSLSQIRSYFGFGGFVHDFQNYVTSYAPNLGGVVQRDLDELLSAIATYEVVGTSQAEQTALDDLRKVIDAYRSNLAEARRLYDKGTPTAEIQRLAAVDNRPAFAALSTLDINWLENLDAETKKLMAGIAAGGRLIKTAAVFVPILAVTVVVLLWFMQRLVQVTVETMRAEQVLRDSEQRNRLFAADVAHELRMPLAVMRLHLEKLEDGQAAKPLLQDVEKVSHMLEQLLAAAKLEDRAAKFVDGVNLHELCVEIAADMAPLAIKEGRTIEVRGPEPEAPVLIRANRFAIEQAVRNLVGNSIKYSARNSKVIIEVTGAPAIKVTDKGPGIPAEKREAIFDPFLRSDRRSSGAGLGLSIVRRVAEVHEATISIGDAPGGGSVFTIAFPPPAHRPGA
jgi:signal transduction histidine kinase